MALPLNIQLMNVDKFIREHDAKPVTSMFIKEPSSDEFNHNGLFSEEIFGQVGSPDRLIRFGYIDLRTKIFHPSIYGNIIKLKALYGEILAGKSYAKFDRDQRDFISCDSDDPDANTGFKFFIDNFPAIVFKKNASITRNDKVDVIEKYKDSCLITKCLVMPAGLRDISLEDGKASSDSINKLYTSLMNYAHAMPSVDMDTDIYDCVRFAIQKKVNEIYEFIFDMCEGKFGFFQRKYSSRNLALGTRNVITPADMSGISTKDPKYLKCDEVKLPLFEACKMYQPLVIYFMKTLFFSEIFSQYADQVAVIDPKTYQLAYQPVSEDEKNKFLTTDGMEKILSLFRDKEFRFNYVTVESEDGGVYYLYLIYDTGDGILMERSLQSIRDILEEQHLIFDPKKLRPITYVELIYIATYVATRNKCATVTRYPAIEVGSCVPCRAHLMSTKPSRTVRFINANKYTNSDNFAFPEYPILNTTFVDSAVLHPSILAGLNADFDGDTVSVNGILTKEANEEVLKYLDSKERYVHTNGSLMPKGTDLIKLTIFNLSR